MKNLFKLLLVTLVLFDLGTSALAQEKKQIFIKGKLKFSIIKFTYYPTPPPLNFNASSSLYLYENKKIEMGIINGKIKMLGQIDSTLVDSQGNFSFNISQSGSYLLFACPDQNCTNVMPYPVSKNDSPIIIDIPKDVDLPYTFDCGEVQCVNNSK